MEVTKTKGNYLVKDDNRIVRFIVDMQAKTSSKGADSGLNKIGWAFVIASLGWAIAKIVTAIAPNGIL